MKSRMLLLSVVFVSYAHAGVTLRIEHPRNPSHVKDLYNVKCNGRCELEIKADEKKKGISNSKLFREKIKDLLSMKAKGHLPQSKENARLVMYKIEVDNGKDKLNLILGYPLSYTGEEYTKYVNVISLIEDIKLKMELELTEKK